MTMFTGVISANTDTAAYSITTDAYSTAYVLNAQSQSETVSQIAAVQTVYVTYKYTDKLPEEQYFEGYFTVDDGTTKQQVYDGCSFVMPAKALLSALIQPTRALTLTATELPTSPF